MEGFSFQPLLIILGIALAVPIVTSRIPGGAVPIVVGEIICGIIVGKSGLNLIGHHVWIDFLSEFGFAFLMFLSGLEVDFHMIAGFSRSAGRGIKSWLGSPPIAGVTIFALSLSGAILGARLISGNVSLDRLIFLALILSTTSVGIVVPVLKERGLTRQPIGQSILMAATAADFVTIFLITVFAGVIGGGPVWKPMLAGTLFAAFFLAVEIGNRLGPVGWIKRISEELGHRTAQLRVRGALALLLVFVVLADAIQAELVLGAFLAGAVIAALSREEGTVLREKLDTMGYGFFVPVFFITVGAEFDMGALTKAPRALLAIPIVLGVAYAVKVVPSLVLAVRFPLRDSLAAGVLISARLSLIIAASVVGLRLGVIDEAENAGFVLIAIVTSVVSPAVFSILYPPAERTRGRVIVVGATETGILLVRRLRMDRIAAVLIESNLDLARQANELGNEVIVGDALSVAVLNEAGARHGTALMAVTANDDFNLNVCLTAKEEFGIENVMAVVARHDRVREFSDRGVRGVSNALAVAIAMDNLLARPEVFGLLSEPGSDLEIVEVLVANQEIAGRAIERVHLPGDARIVFVQREGLSFVPHQETVLERGDLVTLVGDRDSLDAARKRLSDGGQGLYG